MSTETTDVDRIADVGSVLNARGRIEVLIYLRDHGPTALPKIGLDLDKSMAQLHPIVKLLLDDDWVRTQADPPFFKPVRYALNEAKIHELIEAVKLLAP